MADSSKDLEIPVWVNGTQKWVTGLTKRTTCDDVIYALLFQDGLQDYVHTSEYAIFEKWREVERPLQGRTKIVKVWRAWGSDQNSVHLSMRRIDELEYSGEFSLTRRKKKSRHRTRDRERHSSRDHHRHHDSTHSSSERLKSMEHLVKLVISQERKVQDIRERIEDTDKLIDKYESRVHACRLKKNGEDYVQNAYLESMSEDSMDDFFSNVNVENMELYVQFCDKIINLEDQIANEHSKMEDLSIRVQESFSEHSQRSPEKGHPSVEGELAVLQVELNRAVSCAIMQQYKSQDLLRELQFSDEKLREKESRYRQLQCELRDSEMLDANCQEAQGNRDYRKPSADNCEPYTPPLPARTRPAATSSNAYGNKDKDRVNPVNAVPLPERKPILKQAENSCKNPATGGARPVTSNGETKVRFKTDSLVDRYCWEESSASEGISIDQSDSSDNREVFDGYTKKEFQLPFVRLGAADKPYQTVKVEDNDSNSDTGLSSMHSDDSAVYHLETLV